MFSKKTIFLAAKQARSHADVLVKLEECGLPSSSETRTFAEEIYVKIPRNASGENVRIELVK